MRTRRIPFVHAVATLLFVTMAIAAAPVEAQFGGLGDAARRAREALQKKREAEEQAKKEKEAEAQKAAEAAKQPPAAAATPAPAAAPATGAAPAGETPAAAAAAPAFQAYSKFDFVPGDLVVAFEDFSQDMVGDFPARWNTNASGEVVTLAGQPGRWLKLTRPGLFLPEFITELPDNVTVEFDLMVPPTAAPGIAFGTALVQLADPKRLAEDWQTSSNTLTFTAHPNTNEGTSSITTRQDSTSGPANQVQTAQLAAKSGRPVHIALWRQRQRVRVYMNEDKVWDLPRAVAASAKFNALLFFFGGGCGNCEYYLANLRVATGVPDTRNKILTEGKWVTRGILFDVNSDRIKGESYGSLKEIASVLTEAADARVVIVGHTDSDGADAANLDLSRRRAAAVKAALATQFGIAEGRMETDGKGESEPVDKNDTPAGKANNRRVEFIRK